MKKLLLSTKASWTSAVQRIVLGLIFFAHGAQKALGWFGGYGFDATMEYFTTTVGLPWIIGFLVIVIEFIGSLCLVLGVFTRLWSLALIILTVGIMLTVHWPFGFFMNWEGTQNGEGLEYFFLVLAIASGLLFQGAGVLSIDKWLQDKDAKNGLVHNTSNQRMFV